MRDILVLLSDSRGKAGELTFEVSVFQHTTQHKMEDTGQTQQTTASGATQAETARLPDVSEETLVPLASQAQCQVFAASLLKVKSALYLSALDSRCHLSSYAHLR